jgi:hypothetical protein
LKAAEAQASHWSVGSVNTYKLVLNFPPATKPHLLYTDMYFFEIPKNVLFNWLIDFIVLKRVCFLQLRAFFVPNYVEVDNKQKAL